MTDTQDAFPERPTARIVKIPTMDGDLLHIRMIEDELGCRYVTATASPVPVNLESDELRMLADAMDAWPEEIQP